MAVGGAGVPRACIVTINIIARPWSDQELAGLFLLVWVDWALRDGAEVRVVNRRAFHLRQYRLDVLLLMVQYALLLFYVLSGLLRMPTQPVANTHHETEEHAKDDPNNDEH